MAAASDVTFDVLLGGKVTPELLKSFQALEELMKKQGATAKTINAVMGRAYKETFDGVAKEGKKDSEIVEKSWKHTFTELAEKAHEMQHKVVESFDKIKESMEGVHESIDKIFEFTGITALLSAVGGALTIEELIKKGIEVRRERATQEETLGATLRGRGRGLETGEWAEAAEKIAATAHVGHTEAMEMMTKLAASGRFAEAGQARQMALSLIGLGGGTAEGAQGAFAAYQRMMLTGNVNPRLVAAIERGSGINVLEQLARDTGIPVADLKKQFAAAKVSKKTGEVTGGALAGAKGIEALNKAINELGQSRGMELIQAHMKGMDGLFYRFGEHWEDFTANIGEFVEKVIDPIGEEINKLIDSIDFTKVFEGMIERGKEWGQLIKAVWDTIANAPVLNTIKAMWQDFWKAFTGGVELYGPYVETWNDKLHHELGTHMARHMTEAGRKWVEVTSKRTIEILQAITDLANRLVETWQRTEPLRVALGKLLDVLKAIDDFLYGHLLPTLFDLSGKGLQQIVKFVEGIVNVFKGLIDKIVAFIPDWLKPKQAAETAAMITTGEYASPAARAAAQRGLEYSATTNDKAAEAALRQADALEKLNALDEQIRKTQEQHNKAIQDATNAFYGRSPGLIPAATDATAALTAFIPIIQQASQAMASMQFGMGAGYGGGGGGGMTEYGPSVPGDQPGGPTYDWNSYHGIGAYTKHLEPGVSVAMHPEYARSHYGIAPGQMYLSDKDHRMHRWDDVTGSKQFDNEDLFKGAMGGIFRKPTRALIGESGPEAVVPLSGAGAAGLGDVTININVAGNAHDPEGIAEAVERVIRAHWRRQAVV